MNAIIDIRSWALLLTCFIGCAQNLPPAEFDSGAWKAELKDVDGRGIYTLRSKQNEVRVKNGAGAILAFLRTGSNGIQIQDRTGQEVGVVLDPSEQRRALRVVAPGGQQTLFELRTEADGDFKILDANDVILYDLKQRDYGYKVLGRDGAPLSSIRVREGKVSVRAATGRTFLWTRDPLPPEAVGVMTLREIPIEIRAGLVVAITRGMPLPHRR